MRPIIYVLLGVLLVPTIGLVGDIVTDGKFKSTMSTGAPLELASDDMVVNLNADMVDGLEASEFALASDTYTKAEVDALVAAAADSRPWYYLTTSEYDGNEATTACDSGFHMASAFEIYDVSNLRYDAVRGMTRDDSGSGPPQNYTGWLRTGFVAATVDTTGLANCDAWASDLSEDYGTYASITDEWLGPANVFSPWEVRITACNNTRFVWCVED